MSNYWTYNALIEPSEQLRRVALDFLLEAFRRRGYVPVHPEKGIVEVFDSSGQYLTAADFEAATILVENGGQITLHHGLDWDVSVSYSPPGVNSPPRDEPAYARVGMGIYGGFLSRRDRESEQVAADSKACLLELCEQFRAVFGYVVDERSMEAWLPDLQIQSRLQQGIMPSHLFWINYVPNSLLMRTGSTFFTNVGAILDPTAAATVITIGTPPWDSASVLARVNEMWHGNVAGIE